MKKDNSNVQPLEHSRRPEPAAHEMTHWYHYIIPPSILSFITFLFYFPSRNYEFQFDDIANIIKYYDIRRNSLRDLFFADSRWIGKWLNGIHYSISKFNPYSYRIGNIIQHIILGNIIFFFVFLALRNLKKPSFFKKHAFSLACMTAALFLLHPVQTQTVSYVIQGKLEGVATFFIVCMAFCFWIAYTTRSKVLSACMTILFFALAVLSSGSKEIAIMSPWLMLLIDWFFVAQGSWSEMRKRWFFHAASFLTTYACYLYFLKPEYFTAILCFKHHVPNNLGNVITSTPLEHITPFAYCISEFKVILHYLWIFIWPFNISVEYDWVLSKGFLAPDSLFPFLVLVCMGYIVYKILKYDRTNLIAFGICWFMVCIAPRSSIIPSAELIVDYKTYAASLGWLFVLAAGMVWLAINLIEFFIRNSQRAQQIAYTAAAICLAIGMGFATMQRNTVWRSGLEFWGNMLKNAPGKPRIYNNYGVELSQKQQKYAESIPYFKKAIAMDRYYPDPHNNLAVVYAYLNRIDDAIAEMVEGLKINPNYPEGHNNLAAFYIQKKDYLKAEESLNIALKLRPTYGKAYYNRARVFMEQNKIEQALSDLKSACTKADFDTDFGFYVYGKFALDHKYYDDAIFAFNQFIKLDPRNAEGFFNLGNAYHLSEKFTQAIGAYQQALTLAPGDVRYCINIGESYMKLNEFEKALSYFEKFDMYKAPYVALRIAECCMKLGNQSKAIEVLEKTLQAPVDANLKEKAQLALANFSQTHA
jgi:tetratricopeptide (TPR) repeat protein